jgi:GNAT superfamily N-acetyltransferase
MGRSPDITLRYARPVDLDFLIEGLEKNRALEKRPKPQIKATSSDKQQFREAVRKKNIRVVEKDGQPIAFLHFRTDAQIMYIDDRFLWVDLIYVKPAYRRQGLGILLYEDAIRLAKRRKFDKIVIDIFDANRASKRFHRSLEFEPLYTIYQKKI